MTDGQTDRQTEVCIILTNGIVPGSSAMKRDQNEPLIDSSPLKRRIESVCISLNDETSIHPPQRETRSSRHSQECKNPRRRKPSVQRQADAGRDAGKTRVASIACAAGHYVQQRKPSVAHVHSSGNIEFRLKTYTLTFDPLTPK